ncbi:MAG: phosphoribosyltransferase family protein [bacterium]
MANNLSVKFLNVTWKGFENECINLSKKIKGLKINKIIAISRGGLVAARILSDLLTIKISHISISSYKNLKQEKEPMISDVPKDNFKSKVILIVDDVSDSGKTLKRAIRYFKDLSVKKIYTATPYVKPNTIQIPDFWTIKTNSWIIFPYEIKETAKAFVKLFKSKKKAFNRLVSLGFNKKIINYILSE